MARIWWFIGQRLPVDARRSNLLRVRFLPTPYLLAIPFARHPNFGLRVPSRPGRLACSQVSAAAVPLFGRSLDLRLPSGADRWGLAVYAALVSVALLGVAATGCASAPPRLGSDGVLLAYPFEGLGDDLATLSSADMSASACKALSHRAIEIAMGGAGWQTTAAATPQASADRAIAAHAEALEALSQAVCDPRLELVNAVWRPRDLGMLSLANRLRASARPIGALMHPDLGLARDIGEALSNRGAVEASSSGSASGPSAHIARA